MPAQSLGGGGVACLAGGCGDASCRRVAGAGLEAWTEGFLGVPAKWNHEYFFLVPLQEGGQVHEVSPKIQAKKSHSARVGTRVDICGDMDVRASVTSEIALRTFGCF